MTLASSSPPLPSLQTSTLLTRHGFRHAFFTRSGGVSGAPFDALNFSVNVGDAPEAVEENVRIAARHLGVTPERLHFPSQVHGRTVLTVAPDAERKDTLVCEGDALVHRSRSGETPLAVGVRTADCVPILLACTETGWVGAVHAGWRGCVNRITLEAVRELRERGAKRLIAAIGPHIELQSFEVSPQVASELLAASPDPDIVDRSRERPHVDLRRMVRAQLISAGLASSEIDDVHGCTYAEPALYFSFRRDGAKSGRHLHAIVARA